MVNYITGRERRSQPAARPCCRLSDFGPPQLSNLLPPLTLTLGFLSRGCLMTSAKPGTSIARHADRRPKQWNAARRQVSGLAIRLAAVGYWQLCGVSCTALDDNLSLIRIRRCRRGKHHGSPVPTRDGQEDPLTQIPTKPAQHARMPGQPDGGGQKGSRIADPRRVYDLLIRAGAPPTRVSVRCGRCRPARLAYLG